jgi:hypothetical protein
MAQDVKLAFSHVADRMQAHSPRREPQHLCTEDVRLMMNRSLDALGRDIINPAVRGHALEIRIEAAKEAKRALDRGQRKRAHTALQRFWMA